MQIERIRPAELEGDELWRRNGEYVTAEAYDKLEAALRKICSMLKDDMERYAPTERDTQSLIMAEIQIALTE